jgi:hypothetical protein
MKKNLSVANQETASCHSCGDVHTKAELDTCPDCGSLLCGKQGCSSLCACDDIASDVRLELQAIADSGQPMPLWGEVWLLTETVKERMASRPATVPVPEARLAVIHEIETMLAKA